MAKVTSTMDRFVSGKFRLGPTVLRREFKLYSDKVKYLASSVVSLLLYSEA